MPETSFWLRKTDILLLLLYAPGPSGRVNEPVDGRTRLQKELFLSQKEVRERVAKGKYPYAFRPYRLGPFSREVYKDIAWMEEEEGVINVERIVMPNKGIFCRFSLTQKGIAEAEEKLGIPEMQQVLEIIEDMKRKYNNMNLTHLVELTHLCFPEYHKHFEDKF